MSEKINKMERKGRADIHIFSQGEEIMSFWEVLAEHGDDVDEDAEDVVPPDPADIKPNVPHDFKPVVPRLYSVGLGMGYLELPQVSVPGNKLKRELLQVCA